MKKRRSFTAEEKSKIVLELLSGNHTAAEVADKYEIHAVQLQKWKKQFLDNMSAPFESSNKKENKELKKMEDEKDQLLKKVGQLTIEVDWLKKKSGIK